MIDEKSIKNRIREARIRAGLSQDEAALRLGIKRNAYGQFERGGTILVSQHLRDFAALVGCSPELLLLGFEPVSPDSDLLRDVDFHRRRIHDLTEDYENRLQEKTQTIRDKDALIESLERTVKVQEDLIRMLNKK